MQDLGEFVHSFLAAEATNGGEERCIRQMPESAILAHVGQVVLPQGVNHGFTANCFTLHLPLYSIKTFNPTKVSLK